MLPLEPSPRPEFRQFSGYEGMNNAGLLADTVFPEKISSPVYREKAGAGAPTAPVRKWKGGGKVSSLFLKILNT